MTDGDSAAAAVARTAELGGSFDILVNNAGSYHEAGSIIDQTWESWKRAIDVNLVERVRLLASRPPGPWWSRARAARS